MSLPLLSFGRFFFVFLKIGNFGCVWLIPFFEIWKFCFSVYSFGVVSLITKAQRAKQPSVYIYLIKNSSNLGFFFLGRSCYLDFVAPFVLTSNWNSVNSDTAIT